MRLLYLYTRQRMLYASLCFFMLALGFSFNGQAQFSPASCKNIQCTSNDVRVVSAYLSGPNDAAINCSAPNPFLNAELHLIVYSNTQRVGVSISGNLNASSTDPTDHPIGQCYTDIKLNTGSNNNLTYSLGTQLSGVQCDGSTFSLNKLFISWGTGNTNFCSGTDPQCPATPAKCRYQPGEVIKVDVKLDIDFSWTPGDCSKGGDGLSVNFTPSVTAQNVTYPLSFKWDFTNDGIIDVTTTANSGVDVPAAGTSYTYPSSGTYTAKLTVSDASGITKSTQHTFELTSCCTLSAPSLTVGPFCNTDNKTVGDLPQSVSDGNGGMYTYHWYDGADPATSSEVDPTTVLKDGDTYYVSISNGTCESPRTAVTITVNKAPSAGTNGTLTICAGTTPTDAQLFAQLGGTPDAGGTWSHAGNVYTYTVAATAPCTDATATVTVSEQQVPNAGTDGTLTVCAGTTPSNDDLFKALGGTPDAGGTWSSPVDNVYTYTVTATAPCTVDATSNVTVTFDPAPTATVSIDGSQTCTGGIAQFKLKGIVTNASSYTWSNNGGDGTFSPASGSLTPTYTPGANDRMYGVTITLTANPASGSTCTTPVTATGVKLTTTPCGPYYTYTQGYYSSTGTSCTPIGGAKGAVALVQYALDYTNGIMGDQAGKLYLGKLGASFTVNYADAANLVKIMPGGGTAAKLTKDYDLDPNTSAPAPPLKNGKINNVLLSQTITLGLNINIQGDGLSSFILKNGYLTTQKGDLSTCPATKVVPCSKDSKAISSLQITTSTGLKNWIAAAPKTVLDLFNLASSALGGSALPSGVSLTDISNAVDVINRSFDQGRFALGYYTTAQSCPPLTSTTTSKVLSNVVDEVPTTLSVFAYPNPYSSNIRFTVANPKAGQGSLEVYNLLGQKVSTVYRGFIPAGTQTYNLNLSPIHRTNLVYRLSVNGNQITGKLLHASE